MKKTLFTLMLMIASALAINAQSLTGKEWRAMIPNTDGTKVALELTFENNGTCEAEVVAMEDINEDGMSMTISVEVEIPGTYTLNGKNLNINLNKDKATIDFDFDFKNVDAQTKAMLKNMMKAELDKSKIEAKNEILDDMPPMDNMKIVSLDSSKLVIADSTGEEMTFYAK